MIRKVSITSFLCLLTLSALSANEPLFQRQWGLVNNGQTLMRETGELSRDHLSGTPGMDIQWMSPQEVKDYALKNDLKTSEKPIIVAVIDSGIDETHPELKGRIWFNDKLCANMSESERLNAPCSGWNFLESTSDLNDDVGHGTHVAGIIAANQDGRGMMGMTPQEVKIMPLKVLNKNVNNFTYKGQVITNVIADAISFATQNGADIINLSLGWPEVIHVPKIIFAIQRAQELGVLVVAATGNNNKDIPTYPCTMPGVVCVGAHDHRGTITEFSNFSGKVDLVAPGEDIVSLQPMNLESRIMRIQGLELKRGSSQAAPYVAGVAAVLKFLYPEISISEIKARLSLSALPLSDIESSKSVKYGRLNMRGAIELAPKEFIEPDFKNVLEIKVNHEGQFQFELPILNQLETVRKIKVNISLGSDVTLTQSEFTIDRLAAQATRRLRLQGELSDMTIDTDQTLKVEIKTATQNLTLQTRVLFMQQLELESDRFTSYPLTNTNPDLVSFFNGPQKLSRLRKVSQKRGDPRIQEWFFQNPQKQSAEQTVISVIKLTQEGSEQLDLTLLSKVNQVLALSKIDINRDGIIETMVYSMSDDRKNLVMSFFSPEGNILSAPFDQWFFPITGFEGLPFTNGVEDFAWIAEDHPKFGKMHLPLIKRQWILPDEDNTFDFLDRLPHGMGDRYYYLNPLEKDGRIELAIRSLESVSFFKKLKEQLRLSDFDQILLSRPFDQTQIEARQGIISLVASIGKEAAKNQYIIKLKSPRDFTIEKLPLGFQSFVSLDNNLARRHLSLNNFAPVDHLSWMALITRERARLISFDQTRSQTLRFEQKNDSYGDPFFNYLGGLKKTGQETLFLESRYSIVAVQKRDGEEIKSWKLPINRDSSFPGLSFSETFVMGAVQSSNGPLPAVYVNATLVFGDRIYAMVATGTEFKRPVDLSYSFPKECIHLELSSSDLGSFVTLLCRDQKAAPLEQMSLKRVKLETGL